ncbi:hypothetical protein [Pararhodobacter zhoushanensis]|uniref:DUF3313 domain-containing protein n=1 Tax=Pararhodobacter zhoushanensis TaxID=2479545 RepID=A0ABT3GVS9_9RHOB|nr:hypothetical protein [Pararhodobacter zhoushanensis]MCW1931636.1 hypothetical protein [Pararhodobacter zhoushanensis]
MAIARNTLKTTLAAGLLALMAACSRDGTQLEDMRAEFSDFRLCYNIVTTNDTVQGPLSREANLDDFADVMRDEIDRRFGRYEGDRLYHIAIHMDAYVLAVPGIPIVASPRSALIISTNLWDDRLGRPLNEEPEQFTILESAGGSSIVGSGLTQNAEQQMAALAANAALRIETWMLEHPEWFEHAGDETAPADAAAAGTDAPAPAASTPDDTAVVLPADAAATPAADPTGTAAAADGTAPQRGCGRR